MSDRRAGPLLLVCTANIARSPMAEVLLRGHLAARGLDDAVEVASAGIYARAGQPAAAPSQRIAERWGFDLSAHRSQPISRTLIEHSSLILTMTEDQRDTVSSRTAGLGARCFTVAEFARLVALGSDRTREPTEPAPSAHGDPDAEPPLVDHITAAVAGANRRRPSSVPSGDEDIIDPYGRGDDLYIEVANQLAAACAIVADALFGPLRSRPD